MLRWLVFSQPGIVSPKRLSSLFTGLYHRFFCLSGRAKKCFLFFLISSQPPGSPSVWIWTRPIVLFNSSSFTMCLHGTFTDRSYFCLKTASHPHQSLLCINLKVTERYLSGRKKKKVSLWVTSNSTDPSQSYRPAENVLRSPVQMCKVRNYFQYASSKIISKTKKKLTRWGWDSNLPLKHLLQAAPSCLSQIHEFRESQQ